MYAQGLTLLVLLASAGFAVTDQTTKDQGEDVLVTDPSDPKHKIKVHHAHKERYSGENLWEDQVAAEEARMKKQHK